jgi:hypothetical protein
MKNSRLLFAKIENVQKSMYDALDKRRILLKNKKDLKEKLSIKLKMNPLPDISNILSEIHNVNQSIIDIENDRMIHAGQFYSFCVELNETRLNEIISKDSSEKISKNIDRLLDSAIDQMIDAKFIM